MKIFGWLPHETSGVDRFEEAIANDSLHDKKQSNLAQHHVVSGLSRRGSLAIRLWLRGDADAADEVQQYCYREHEDFETGMIDWAWKLLEDLCYEHRSIHAGERLEPLHWLSLHDLAHCIAHELENCGDPGFDYISEEYLQEEWLEEHGRTDLPSEPPEVPRDHAEHIRSRLLEERSRRPPPNPALAPVALPTFQEVTVLPSALDRAPVRHHVVKDYDYEYAPGYVPVFDPGPERDSLTSQLYEDYLRETSGQHLPPDSETAPQA